MRHVCGGLAAALLPALWAGCVKPGELYVGLPGTTETHVVVRVLQGAMGTPAARLRSVASNGDRSGEQMLQPENGGAVAFPTTYTIRVPGGHGVLTVLVEAQDEGGVVRGRARGQVELEPSAGTALELTLQAPCVAAQDCSDGVFCNGQEVCEDGICRPGTEACRAAFPCIDAACLEAEQRCALTPVHDRCPPLDDGMGGTGPSYCDTTVGCTRGSPCADDAACADSSVCNGTEQCLSGRCIPGVPLNVNDNLECTADACVEPDGARHFSLPDGNRCGSGTTDICLGGVCVTSRCGDAYQDLASEACDDGPNNSNVRANACREDCTLPRCGDTVTDFSEACDDGNTDPEDACLPTCVANVCGDGILNRTGAEECDDGNQDLNDGCLPNCRLNVELPVVMGGTHQTDEDTYLDFELQAAGGNRTGLLFHLARSPTSGSVQLDTDSGYVRYTPDRDFWGQDDFEWYIQRPGLPPSELVTETVNVLPINDPPRAVDLNVTGSEDTAVTVALSAFDVDGDAIGFELDALPAHGDVMLVGPGAVLYRPAPDFNGMDTFAFVAVDANNARSAAGRVDVTLAAVDDPPVPRNALVPFDLNPSGPTLVNATLEVDDPDTAADQLCFTLVTLPQKGTLMRVPRPNETDASCSPSLVYTPGGRFDGEDALVFTVAGAAGGATGTVRFTRPTMALDVRSPELEVTVDVNNLTRTITLDNLQAGRNHGFIFNEDGAPPLLTCPPGAPLFMRDGWLVVNLGAQAMAASRQYTCSTAFGGTLDFVIQHGAGQVVVWSAAPDPQATNAFVPAMAPDEAWVVYEDAPARRSARTQVLAFNRITGQRVVVSSVDGTPATAGDGPSWGASVGSSLVNGTRVAFLTRAPRLGGADAGDTVQVVVKNLTQPLNAPVLVSRASMGGGGADRDVVDARISPDGRQVVFTTRATNVVGGVLGQQVFLVDLDGNMVPALVSSPDGVTTSMLDVYAAASVSSARLVTFHGTSQLTGTSGQPAQVWVKDMTMPASPMRLVSSLDGTVGNKGLGDSTNAVVSDNGLYVTFLSRATNFGPFPTVPHVYRKSLLNVAVPPLQLDPGNPGGVLDGFAADEDARFVAYAVANSYQEAGPAGTAGMQVVRRDAESVVTPFLRASSADGSRALAANAPARWPSVSRSGRYVVFESRATNLQIGSRGVQVFLKDMQSPASPPQRLSSGELAVPREADEPALTLAVAATGTAAVMVTEATSLLPSGMPAPTQGQVYVRSTQDVTQSFRLASAEGATSDTAAEGGCTEAVVDGSGTKVAMLCGPSFGQGGTGVWLKDMASPGSPPVMVNTYASSGSVLYNPSMVRLSQDGRYVAFRSYQPLNGSGASAFVAWRVDLQGTPRARPASTRDGYDQVNARDLTLSPDGRFVVFSTDACINMPCSCGASHLFRQDMGMSGSGSVQMVTTNGGSTALCADPSVSTNGRYVAFRCQRAYNVNNVYCGSPVWQVFVRDMNDPSGNARLVSSLDGTAATAAEQDCGPPSLDPAGRYVAFSTLAPSLGGTRGREQVLVTDLAAAGRPPRVMSVKAGTTQPANGGSRLPVVAQDGTLMFISDATDLALGAGGTGQVYRVQLPP